MVDRESVRRNRDRQVQRLLDLGFSRLLGVSDRDYARRFPPTESIRVPAGSRFDRLVAVEASLALEDQHRAAGIKEAMRSSRLVTAGPRPARPYFIWVCDSRQWSGASLVDSRAQLSDTETGCSQLEVTSAFLQHPELFRGRGLDSELTVDGDRPDYHSTLVWVQDPPELALHHRADRTAGLGMLVRSTSRTEAE